MIWLYITAILVILAFVSAFYVYLEGRRVVPNYRNIIIAIVVGICSVSLYFVTFHKYKEYLYDRGIRAYQQECYIIKEKHGRTFYKIIPFDEKY